MKTYFKNCRSVLNFVGVIVMVGVCMSATSIENNNPNLVLEISNVRSDAPLYISLCTKKEEWTDRGTYTFKFDATANVDNTFTINSVPRGTYAIALYQDLNGNGRHDTNFLGVPVEPFAFSNNRKPGFAAPSFEKCRFSLDDDNQKLTITLLK